jgi:hypothetical protein
MEIGGLLMNLPDLKAMSQKELLCYISENRNDDEKVRAAIAESSSRPGWTEVPANTPLEEQERIIKELIDKTK